MKQTRQTSLLGKTHLLLENCSSANMNCSCPHTEVGISRFSSASAKIDPLTHGFSLSALGPAFAPSSGLVPSESADSFPARFPRFGLPLPSDSLLVFASLAFFNATEEKRSSHERIHLAFANKTQESSQKRRGQSLWPCCLPA